MTSSPKRLQIATQDIQLEVSIFQSYVSFVVYRFIDQIFFGNTYENGTIAQMTMSLFQNNESIFQYLHEAVNKSRFVSFQQPNLLIKCMICQGKSQLIINFPLEVLDITIRNKLLREKIKNIQNQITFNMSKYSRLIGAQATHIQRRKTLRRHLRQQIKKEQQHQQQTSKLLNIRSQLFQKIKKEGHRINSLQRQLSYYSQKTTQIQTYDIKLNRFILIPDLENPYYQFFAISGNTISNHIKQHQLYSQIISQNYIPFYQKWNVKIKAINIRYGVTIGITGQENKNKQVSYDQQYTFCYCGRNKSVYVDAFRRQSKDCKVYSGDIITITVSMVDRIIKMHKNGEQFEEIMIPTKLSKRRFYPFIELCVNDIIELMQDERNSIQV